MMSIRSLADFNRSSLGGDSDLLTPPPSPPRPHTPVRHDERGAGTFNWPPARTSTWPHAGTFSWPRTPLLPYLTMSIAAMSGSPLRVVCEVGIWWWLAGPGDGSTPELRVTGLSLYLQDGHFECLR